MSIGHVYFFVCALLALAGAVSVVVSKNPIRGAMGLLLLILSVAGLFLALHAQFLAAIQLIVYAGAIVILFLFVIMLLGPSAATPSDRRGLAGRVFGGGLFALSGLAVIAASVTALVHRGHPMDMTLPDADFGGIDAIGTVLFSRALVPFELSSALLMVAVLGAVAVAKGRQGVKSLTKAEVEAGRTFHPEESPRGLAEGGTVPGVFSHEIHLSEGTGDSKGDAS